nr:DUF364 domain-containing protein [uncultured Holophaga sp.]
MIAGVLYNLLANASPVPHLSALEIHPTHIRCHSFRESCIPRFHSLPELQDTTPRDLALATWIGCPAKEAASFFLEGDSCLEVAVGMAILDSLLPVPGWALPGEPFQLCAHLAERMRTVSIGDFPEARRWARSGWNVKFPELFPHPDSLDWAYCQKALAHAELVFITGLTLINGSFAEVIRRTPRARFRVLLGPCVPCSPALLDAGIHMVASSIPETEGVMAHMNLCSLPFVQALDRLQKTPASTSAWAVPL